MRISKKLFQILTIYIFLIILFSVPIYGATNSNKKIIQVSDILELPDDLKIGDLLFIESISFFHNIHNSWDHVAMYIGDNLFVEANNYSRIPILGRENGVQITPLWKFRLWAQYWTFGNVKTANESQRLDAVNWALDQIGKNNYQVSWGNGYWWANPNPNDLNDPNSNNWYCAELIWASYYNISKSNINLDISPGPLPPPRGDGIHFAVSPQAIESHEDVVLYVEKGAPSSPKKPFGSLTNITYPQVGIYSTNTVNDNQGLYYQWVWGDSFHPEPWGEFVSSGSSEKITKLHIWDRLNIHDRLDNNFAFDIRVRSIDSNGRFSNWSDPLPVQVKPNTFEANWLSPNGYIDTGWNCEHKAFDSYYYRTSTKYSEYNDNGWCDEPLTLTMDKSRLIRGFRIHAKKGIFLDEMELVFFNGSNHVKTFSYSNWPILRWKIVDFERYRYMADKVEIRFHLFDKYLTNSYPDFHAEVYDFDFWIE